MLLRILTVVTVCITALLRPADASQPLPPQIQSCFERTVKELMLIEREDTARLRQFFRANINADFLGSRSVGGLAWRQGNEAWRTEVLDYYFSFLVSKGESLAAGMRDVNATVISARLADRPDIRPEHGFHVAASITLDNGNSFSVAVLLTHDCKAFDFSQGGWVSRLFDANTIDAIVRAKRGS